MTALLGLWRLFFFVDFLNDAYFLYYVFSGKCLYDGLIRAMTLIVFLQISPYDAYYVYDAYSGVESSCDNVILILIPGSAIFHVHTFPCIFTNHILFDYRSL